MADLLPDLGLPENWTSDFTTKLGMREYHEKDPSDYVMYLEDIKITDYHVIYYYQCEGEQVRIYEPRGFMMELHREHIIDEYKRKMGL